MSTETKDKISKMGIIVWLCCLTFYLYEFFLRTFIGTLAGSIISGLHLTPELFSIMGGAYYLSYSLMQIPVGYITDKFGAKRAVISALILCAISVFIFSLARGFALGFIARLLMGLGSSFGFVSLLVVITNWFPQRVHAMYIAISQFIGTLGPLIAAGPLVSIMTQLHMGWRVLLVHVAVLALILAAIFFILMRSKSRTLETSETITISRPQGILKMLKTLFRNKQAWLVAFYSGFTYETMDYLGATWGPLFLRSRGLSLELAGYCISIGWLGFAIGCPVITLFSQMMHRRKPMLVLCGVMGTVSTFFMIYVPLNAFWLYLIAFFFIGLAGSALNLGIATIIEHVDVSVKALALGFNNGMIVLFGAILPIGTSFFFKFTGQTVPEPQDFFTGFAVLPSMFFIATILALFFIKETFCKPQKGILRISPKG